MERHADQEFEALKQDLVRMATLAETAIGKAIQALILRDVEMAEDVIRADDTILSFDDVPTDSRNELIQEIVSHQPGDVVNVVVLRDNQRLTLTATLGTARIPLQVDVGFGDAVTPGVETATFPTLLDFPAPTIRVYPPETVIAEKYQAMGVFAEA